MLKSILWSSGSLYPEDMPAISNWYTIDYTVWVVKKETAGWVCIKLVDLDMGM